MKITGLSRQYCLCLSFLFSAFLTYGKPVIYQATGTKPEDIRPVVEQFKRDILFGTGNSALPSG